MARRSDLDQRFAHFCRTGDPAALGEVFDGTARELLHVAVWLAGNRTDAEDLLQRTFLCAIETRARFDAGLAVLPWLMGILAIEARHLRRERARKLAAAPAQPARDPEAEVAANELDAEVQAIGDDLGEPYREVLRLHLQQGLNAKEIAARLQRPGGTVRTQLVRALEMLRRKLPGGFVAGLAPLVLPEHVVLATVRTAVMQAAKVATPVPVVGAAGAATRWMVTGGLTMSKKVAALAAVALVLGVGAWALRREEARPAGGAPTVVREGADGAASDAAARPALRTAVAVPEAAASPTTGALVVHVAWQDDDSPAAAVGVAVWPTHGQAHLQERLAVSGPGGECRFEALPPGDHQARSATGDSLAVAIVAGTTSELQLHASRVVTVRGVVVDEFDRPVQGADIWLSEVGNFFRGYVVAQSDAQGRFAVASGYSGYLGARKAGQVASFWRGYHAYAGGGDKPQREFEFTLQLRGAAGAIRGRVVDAQRQPIAGARVFVGPQIAFPAPGLRSLNGEHEPRGITVVTDADGNFARDDVRPGPTDVRAWAEGHGPVESGVAMQASTVATLELVLPPPAVLQGVVRDGDGNPIAAAQVQIGSQYDFLAAATQSAADGTYRLGDLAAGDVNVTAEKPGDLKAETTATLAAGAITTWDPVLATTRTLRGVVLDPSGQPMRGVLLETQPWMAPGAQGVQLVDDDGRFAFTDVSRDSTQILIVRQGNAALQALAVPPGQDEVTIRLLEEDLPTASLRLCLVDVAGQPVPARLVLSRPGENHGMFMTQASATGVAELKAMRPGSYELKVMTTDLTMPLPSVTFAAHESKDLGNVVLPSPGTLRLRVRTAASEPPGLGWITLVSASGQSCVTNPPRLRGGELELAAPPGIWTLIVHTPEATASTPVTLQSGSVTECSLTMLACRAVAIELALDASVFAFGMMRVLVHRQEGRLQYCSEVFTQRDGSITSTFHVPPGDYTFTAIGPNDSRGTAKATVPAEGTAAPLRIGLHAAH